MDSIGKFVYNFYCNKATKFKQDSSYTVILPTTKQVVDEIIKSTIETGHNLPEIEIVSENDIPFKEINQCLSLSLK